MTDEFYVLFLNKYFWVFSKMNIYWLQFKKQKEHMLFH